MDKKQLQQYQDLIKEINEVKTRLDRRTYVTDKVMRSNPEFPYEMQSLTIHGKDERVNNVLRHRLTKAKNMCADIEEFIADIPFARERRVFEMRYIKGWSWLRISIELGKDYESYARQVHDRYLYEIEKEKQ